MEKTSGCDYDDDGNNGWLVGCFGFNGPLRQYFSLYRAVSQRVGWLVVLGLTAL